MTRKTGFEYLQWLVIISGVVAMGVTSICPRALPAQSSKAGVGDIEVRVGNGRDHQLIPVLLVSHDSSVPHGRNHGGHPHDSG